MKVFKRTGIVFIVVFILSILGFYIYFNYGKPWEYFTYKDKFETYLEEKYDGGFVIEDMSFDRVYGSTYHAYAHPEVESGMEFYVGQNTRTKEIEDGYADQKWQYQAWGELDPVIEKIFLDRKNHSIEIIPVNPDEENTKQNYKKATTVEIGISKDNTIITDANKAKELKSAFKLLVELQDKGVELHHFGIGYENKTMQLKPEQIESIQDNEDLAKHLINYQR